MRASGTETRDVHEEEAVEELRAHDEPPAADPASDGRVVAELRAALDHRERQIEALRRTSDALFSHDSVEAMVRETLRVALDVLCADAGTLYLYDPPTDSLVFRYVVGPTADKLIGTSMPASTGIAGQVFRSGVPDLTQKAYESGNFNRAVDAQSGYNTQSIMTVPVKRPDGDPIGVMQVMNFKEDAFDHRDLEVLQVLCAQAATAIEHARLSEQGRRAEIGNRVGEIAHDIKNMMTPIQSGVWTLQPMLEGLFEDLDAIRATCPETESWADEIARAADAVRGDYGWLLDNALTAAERVRRRTEYIAGMVKGNLPPPHFEEADLNETAREVVKTLTRVAREKDLDLSLDLDPDLPRASFDYDRMYDALYNLVNNAIPETPPGGRVTLRTRAPEPDGQDDRLCVQVQDTGRGIPEHVRERLFTADAISTKPGGTGLGTSVVARIVAEHGGTIGVDSAAGAGSTFPIRLPLRHDD
jgi:signal transduction histidine kinase